MTPDEIAELRRIADRGWHEARMYSRGDGLMAMSTPTGHPLAPALARLLKEREALLKATTDLLETMSMQEKRESGAFHITGEVAFGIWSDAKARALGAIALAES